MKKIALCAALAIVTLTGCGSEQEMSRKDRKALKEIERQLDEIEKNNRQINFMLCQLRLLDRVDLKAPDANDQMEAIFKAENIEKVKQACGLD